jgi:arylsulfatase A-like enzyme
MIVNKPNILLITTDTQRCDTLNCMGYDFAKSPNLDRLAREGVMFTQGHTTSPVCGPTRCSLITGVHPPIHEAIENGMKRREDLAVFPDALAEAGYTCIMSGKTHFGNLPASFTIDHSTSGSHNAKGQDAYTEKLKEHGFDDRPRTYPHDVPDDLFYDGYTTTMALEGIDEAVSSRPDAPFFAFCSMLSPHGPLIPPGDWGDAYANEDLPEFPRNPSTESEPEHAQKLLGLRGNREKSEDEINEIRRLYYGLSAYIDYQVGRMLDYLDEKGLAENTLVIFTSDHGIDLYDHGFDNKHVYYDNTWRVPFLMRLPGQIEAGVTREFALWNDIPATILGAAGLTSDLIQGFDLFNPAVAREASPRRCAVSTLYKSCALATRRWKLEYYFEEGTCRLFDREKDPGEHTDLSTSAGHAGVRAAMIEALLAWRGDIVNTEYLKAHTNGNAPVANRVTGFVKEISGRQPEERLNRRAEEIDRKYGKL